MEGLFDDAAEDAAEEVMSIVSAEDAIGRVEGALFQCLSAMLAKETEITAASAAVQILGRDLMQTPKLFMRTLQLVSFLHGLLLEDRMCSQRDVFYQLVALFSSPEECYRDLEHICRSLRLSRISLNIYAASRGFVVGELEVTLYFILFSLNPAKKDAGRYWTVD